MYSKRMSELVEQRESLKRAGIHYYTKVWGLDEKDSWKKISSTRIKRGGKGRIGNLGLVDTN